MNTIKTLADEAACRTLGDLPELWHELRHCATLLNAIDAVHLGVDFPPRTERFYSFEYPPLTSISFTPACDRSRSLGCQWEEPKIVMNSARMPPGPWCVAAFVDDRGLIIDQTFTGIWPKNAGILQALAAVLNGPVANAFIATREAPGSAITKETFLAIPIPRLTEKDDEAFSALVAAYHEAVAGARAMTDPDWRDAEAALRRIDAKVLCGYELSPRTERKLLDYFRGQPRPVPFRFGDYFPPDFRPYVPLAEYLADDLSLATAHEVRRRFEPAPIGFLRAIKAGNGGDRSDA